MKTLLTALTLGVASAFALPAVSQAADTSGVFINGNVGRSSLDKAYYDDSDTGFGVNVGYRWALAPGVLVGVEGGYADLGKFDPKSAYDGLGMTRAKVDGWNLGVNGHFNLTENWYISGRTGWFHGNVKGSTFTTIDSATVPVGVDGSSNKWYAGAGFGYDFSNNASVGLNYDYYKASVDGLTVDPGLTSVSFEYRF